MTSTNPLPRILRRPGLRHHGGFGLMTVAFAGAIATITTPAAEAETMRVCHLTSDFDNGVVLLSRSYGQCDVPAGKYFQRPFGAPGIWIVNLPTPDGNSVTAGLYNIWNLPT